MGVNNRYITLLDFLIHLQFYARFWQPKVMKIRQPKVVEVWPLNVTTCCGSPHCNCIFSSQSGNHGVLVS